MVNFNLTEKPFFVFIALTLLSFQCLAGTINGVIKNSSGQRLAGVSIILKNPGSSFSTAASSASDEPYAEEKNELLADWLEQQVQQKDKRGNSDLLKKIVYSKPSKNRYELMLRQRAEEQLKLSNGEEAAVKRDDLKGMIPSDHDLVSQIKEGNLAGYWPILIRKIYFEQDQRLF